MGTIFSAEIDKFIAKAKGNLDLVVRKVSLDLFRKVIIKSPVDKGRFKGNWQVAIGSIPAGALKIDDKSGTATISKVTAETLKMKAGDVITLVNNVPYARRLEYGHSKQAPAGMVRTTVTEYGAVVREAVNSVARN